MQYERKEPFECPYWYERGQSKLQRDLSARLRQLSFRLLRKLSGVRGWQQEEADKDWLEDDILASIEGYWNRECCLMMNVLIEWFDMMIYIIFFAPRWVRSVLSR